jgi:hypothetical protein
MSSVSMASPVRRLAGRFHRRSRTLVCHMSWHSPTRLPEPKRAWTGRVGAKSFASHHHMTRHKPFTHSDGVTFSGISIWHTTPMEISLVFTSMAPRLIKYAPGHHHLRAGVFPQSHAVLSGGQAVDIGTPSSRHTALPPQVYHNCKLSLAASEDYPIPPQLMR